MLVEIDIYSGQPNPRFPLDADSTAALRTVLRGLSPAASAPSAPGLGYRGFRLVDDDGTTSTVYRGVMQTPAGLLADPDMRIEQFLIAQLPADLETLRPMLSAELGLPE